MAAADLAALAVAFLALGYDLSMRRIPNLLTFSAAAAALVFHGVAAGWTGVAHAGAGLIVGLLMFLPVFWLGGLGGGDVKLLAALGAWIGPGPALWMAAFTALAGGPLAVLVAVWHGYGRTMVENVWSLLMFWRVAGVRPHPALTLETGTAPRLPYAIPIAAGLIATLWFR